MQKLFSEFNSTTADAWKEQIIKDLKATDFKSLIWKTNSGIDVKPFYTATDIELTDTETKLPADWSICEYIDVVNEKEANAKALNALQNGASGLVFSIRKKTNFEILCANILFVHIYTLFKVSPEFETELRSYLKNTQNDKHCFIENDTILNGHINIENITDTLVLDTTIYNESGANSVNQLAFSVSHINDYLHELNTLKKLESIKVIHLSCAIGGDFFMEIAKLKALRNLTQFILQQYQVNAHIHIHAQTTLVNKSHIDIYNNLLRSTTECMSAVIGGSDSIVVFPFDYTLKPDSDFSSRMARNQQLILKDESYLNQVSDIAAGSYYIESVTKTMCEMAWQSFKAIEEKGGFINALKLNYIQTLIAEDANKLISDFKEGKLILVGVNKFENKNEPKELNSMNQIIDKATSSLAIKEIKPLRLNVATPGI